MPKGFQGFQRGVPNVNKGKVFGRRSDYAAAKKLRDAIAAIERPLPKSIPIPEGTVLSIRKGVKGAQRGGVGVNLGKRFQRGPQVVLKAARRRKLEAYLAHAQAHPPTPSTRVTLAMTNPYNARPGQVWVNVDRRAGVHWKGGAPAVRLERIQPPYAFGFWCSKDGVYDPNGEIRVARIRLDLLRPWEEKRTCWSGLYRGWRLLG